MFVGMEWYKEVLRDPSCTRAVSTAVFSAAVLAIQIPLGIALALAMPVHGWRASLVLVLLAMPLLVPWNVVGTIWQIFGRAGHRPARLRADAARLRLQLLRRTRATPGSTVLVMDVWHWTPLVALLAYAGLRAIPEAYYQAARIDGASRWAVFRHIQLPKMRGVLMIAVLLRFMDSFMIYTEPFVLTGGGPGTATTFLSQYLTQKAVGQFDLGPAAAFSLVYFLIILLLCFVLYTFIRDVGTSEHRQARHEDRVLFPAVRCCSVSTCCSRSRRSTGWCT